MSTTNNMNTRLFIDMDGTLAVWKQAACFEDLLQPGYFRDLPPYQTVLDAVKILCNTKPELDVYALSPICRKTHMQFMKRTPGSTLIFRKLIPNTASSLRAAAAKPEPQQTA